MKKRSRVYFWRIKSRKLFYRRSMDKFFESIISCGLAGTNVFINESGKVEVKFLTPEECLEWQDRINNGEQLPESITLITTT